MRGNSRFALLPVWIASTIETGSASASSSRRSGCSLCCVSLRVRDHNNCLHRSHSPVIDFEAIHSFPASCCVKLRNCEERPTNLGGFVHGPCSSRGYLADYLRQHLLFH